MAVYSVADIRSPENITTVEEDDVITFSDGGSFFPNPTEASVRWEITLPDIEGLTAAFEVEATFPNGGFTSQKTGVVCYVAGKRVASAYPGNTGILKADVSRYVGKRVSVMVIANFHSTDNSAVMTAKIHKPQFFSTRLSEQRFFTAVAPACPEEPEPVEDGCEPEEPCTFDETEKVPSTVVGLTKPTYHSLREAILNGDWMIITMLVIIALVGIIIFASFVFSRA